MPEQAHPGNAGRRSALRLAIIGSGAIANTHASAIAQLDDARLVAVCSRNRTAAAELARPSQARVFDSVEDLACANGIDAVLIATPSGCHAEAVIPMLRAGRHVLCEKPLEVTTERVCRMLEEAGRAGVLLGGFFPLRCGSGAQAIRRALDAGRFGRLTFLSARVKWWRDEEYYRSSTWRGTWELDGGGALMNQGIHAVDLLQWFGGRPHEISAFSGRLIHCGIEVEDTLVASLRFKNGCLGSIEASTACYPGLDLSLEISGDAGTAILINDRIECWQFIESQTEDEDIRDGRLGGGIRGGSSDPKAISCEGHRQQIAEFCRAIRGEAADPIMGLEASVAISIVEAAYRSAQSRKVEPIAYAISQN